MKILLSLIINDDKLSTPIYLQGMICEEQAQAFGTLYPFLYAWNEYLTDAGHLGFNFSINGSAIDRVVEQIFPRKNPNFAAIRDEIMSVLSDVGNKNLLDMVKKTLLPPSQLLKNFEYKDMINLTVSP